MNIYDQHIYNYGWDKRETCIGPTYNCIVHARKTLNNKRKMAHLLDLI